MTQSKFSRNIVSLKTNGYELRFYLARVENSQDSFFKAKVEFATTPNCSQKISAVSEKISINPSDLIRLKKYFQEHMKNIKNNSQEDSYIFVDNTLGYQVRALCGDVSKNGKTGSFGIISMVNIGKTKPFGSSTYIGGESIITFEQVEEFIIALENCIIS